MKNKNIHILPTIDKRCKNIYITSDEEINGGDWFIWMNNKVINQAETDLDIINKHLKNGDVKKNHFNNRP